MRKINEIFYSLQGEGFYVGTPAVFIRFSGCNLQCPFCDTLHEEGEWMEDEALRNRVLQYPARHVVLTGGEPSLFIDDKLVRVLQEAGKYVAIETNGTHLLPNNIDWITLSPKSKLILQRVPLVLTKCDELKVIYLGQAGLDDYFRISASHYYLQPCDTGDVERNKVLQVQLMNYLLSDPRWKLSVQLHKIIGIP